MDGRPYIILNGTSSESIDGLLVQSLPPIRKPAMRYDAEEIDGRAGDIVTTLGYKAYDKSVEIGLYGDFDIDKVIEFFSGSGTVTFSNEIDKEYDYQILDAIDFERAIRFRTATVKLHVQPYKRSTMERAKVWTFSEQSQSVKVVNSGNTPSCPTITLSGSGSVGIFLNGASTITVSMPESWSIRIDVAGMNAYNGSSDNLANRFVVGDYSSLMLPHGTNAISWNGNVTELGISNYSRWI